MFEEIIRAVTSVIGWAFLTIYLLFEGEVALAAMIGATGTIFIIQYARDILYIHRFNSMMFNNELNVENGMHQWSIEKINAIPTDNPNEWDVQKFEKIGYMYFDETEDESIIRLLHEVGEIEDNYDPDNFNITYSGNVIYITQLNNGRPRFRLEQT